MRVVTTSGKTANVMTFETESQYIRIVRFFTLNVTVFIISRYIKNKRPNPLYNPEDL